jgi:hypothetical protein
MSTLDRPIPDNIASAVHNPIYFTKPLFGCRKSQAQQRVTIIAWRLVIFHHSDLHLNGTTKLLRGIQQKTKYGLQRPRIAMIVFGLSPSTNSAGLADHESHPKSLRICKIAISVFTNARCHHPGGTTISTEDLTDQYLRV